jgi:serralysin
VSTYTTGGGNETITVFGNGKVYAGGGNDSITITGNGLISIGGGQDTLSLYGSGRIYQNGPGGNDTINFGSGNDTLFEQGTATVYGAFGSGATLAGGELKFLHVGGKLEESILGGGPATLLGGSQPTKFIDAGLGPVSMQGGSGNDSFIGGAASDTMTGGTGSNVFAFLSADAGGHHVITNFVSGQDKLYVEGHTLSYLNTHGDITHSGANTVITLSDGTVVTLDNVSSLKASDITHTKP